MSKLRDDPLRPDDVYAAAAGDEADLAHYGDMSDVTSGRLNAVAGPSIGGAVP